MLQRTAEGEEFREGDGWNTYLMGSIDITSYAQRSAWIAALFLEPREFKYSSLRKKDNSQRVVELSPKMGVSAHGKSIRESKWESKVLTLSSLNIQRVS